MWGAICTGTVIAVGMVLVLMGANESKYDCNDPKDQCSAYSGPITNCWVVHSSECNGCNGCLQGTTCLPNQCNNAIAPVGIFLIIFGVLLMLGSMAVYAWIRQKVNVQPPNYQSLNESV